MNKRPTYNPHDLVPQEIGPFTRRQHREDAHRAKYSTQVVPLPTTFDARTLTLPTAVASIRKAFLLAKTSHRGWKTLQREGRLDIRQAPRVSRGELDVFKRKSGASTTHVKVSVLIDASGSMSANDAHIEHPFKPGAMVQVQRRVAAAVFGATIAKALGAIPTVDLDVFQHAARGHGLLLKWRWHKGTPATVFNGAALGHIGGISNADGHALYAITERMLQTLKRDERGVIMVVSDGLPSSTASDSDSSAGQALLDAVAHARKNGIIVLGVAIDGSNQSVYYGDGYIPFTGNWTTLGGQLAKVIGNALAKSRR